MPARTSLEAPSEHLSASSRCHTSWHQDALAKRLNVFPYAHTHPQMQPWRGWHPSMRPTPGQRCAKRPARGPPRAGQPGSDQFVGRARVLGATSPRCCKAQPNRFMVFAFLTRFQIKTINLCNCQEHAPSQSTNEQGFLEDSAQNCIIMVHYDAETAESTSLQRHCGYSLGVSAAQTHGSTNTFVAQWGNRQKQPTLGRSCHSSRCRRARHFHWGREPATPSANFGLPSQHAGQD